MHSFVEVLALAALSGFIVSLPLVIGGMDDNVRGDSIF